MLLSEVFKGIVAIKFKHQRLLMTTSQEQSYMNYLRNTSLAETNFIELLEQIH